MVVPSRRGEPARSLALSTPLRRRGRASLCTARATGLRRSRRAPARRPGGDARWRAPPPRRRRRPRNHGRRGAAALPTPAARRDRSREDPGRGPRRRRRPRAARARRAAAAGRRRDRRRDLRELDPPRPRSPGHARRAPPGGAPRRSRADRRARPARRSGARPHPRAGAGLAAAARAVRAAGAPHRPARRGDHGRGAPRRLAGRARRRSGPAGLPAEAVRIAAWRSARELRALVDEIARVDWRDPAWWAVIGGAAAIEGLGRAPRADGYVVSGGEPAADTFMGWPAPPVASLAEAIADAISDGHAAAAALRALDGTLPDQPLARVLRDRKDGPRAVAADPADVVFVVGTARLPARLSGVPDDDDALAATLARLARAPAPDRADPLTARGPTAPIAIVLGDHAPATARHLHRRAWTDAGGPWLGVGRAGPLALASTCHVIVDGYGHALIASRIAARRDDAARRRRLAATAAAIVGDAACPGAAAAGQRHAARRGLASPRVGAALRGHGARAGLPAPRRGRRGWRDDVPGVPGPGRARRQGRPAALASPGRPRAALGALRRRRARAAGQLRRARRRGDRARGRRPRPGQPPARRHLRGAGAARPQAPPHRRRAQPWLHAPVEVLAGRSALSVLRVQAADAAAPPGAGRRCRRPARCCAATTRGPPA